MEATKPKERSQDSRRECEDLDRRYGKIGISAVAAALRCKGEQAPKKSTPVEPIDRD